MSEHVTVVWLTTSATISETYESEKLHWVTTDGGNLIVRNSITLENVAEYPAGVWKKVSTDDN